MNMNHLNGNFNVLFNLKKEKSQIKCISLEAIIFWTSRILLEFSRELVYSSFLAFTMYLFEPGSNKLRRHTVEERSAQVKKKKSVLKHLGEWHYLINMFLFKWYYQTVIYTFTSVVRNHEIYAAVAMKKILLQKKLIVKKKLFTFKLGWFLINTIWYKGNINYYIKINKKPIIIYFWKIKKTSEYHNSDKRWRI